MKFAKKSLGQNFLIDKNIIIKIIRLVEIKNKHIIEIGPGKVLTGMVRRTKKNANCFSINSIADIRNLINELKK